MPLQAVMLLLDSSESSRNGDYAPTRFEAQVDAVNILFDSITQGNPESSVGLMSMGGKGPEVLSTLTTDRGKLLEGMHRTQKKISGSLHLTTGIQVAGLALKHRQNRSQRQRVIAFVCSPVDDEEKKLVSLAKKMKKLNVDVDFILFGDLDENGNQKKLEAFNNTVKSSGNSHLVVIPPSGKLLSDQLFSTPIFGDAAAATAGGSGAESGGDFGGFDFDPSTDPELALALRMSMEEENARQAKAAKEEEAAKNKSNLEEIKEEGENQPLSEQGEASGSGDKKDKDRGDKMDTS
ncbi:von Willebrand factor type A domain-containing protein [Xylaria sp. CBS 124048]|nr:von Willebrand factor type A domain-containing protein [Xylaria sp. CBS 124048]